MMHTCQVSAGHDFNPRLKNPIGAMVLGHSLKDKGASARLVVLATLDTLSASTITELKVWMVSIEDRQMLTLG